jgi:hypothetical protein
VHEQSEAHEKTLVVTSVGPSGAGSKPLVGLHVDGVDACREDCPSRSGRLPDEDLRSFAASGAALLAVGGVFVTGGQTRR